MNHTEATFMLVQNESLRGQKIENGVNDMREDAGKGLTDVAACELQFSSGTTETEACGLVGPDATIHIHFDGRLQHKGAI